MALDKLSMQFSIAEAGYADTVLEAYERLISDAMSGDATLFTTAEGIERLWEVSMPLLSPPDVLPYAQGSWGPERSTTWSPPTAGGCRSSGAGARRRGRRGAGGDHSLMSASGAAVPKRGRTR